MADNSEELGGELPAPKDTGETQIPSGKNDALPNTESPPLSPAGDSAEAPSAPQPALEPTDLVVFAPETARTAPPRFRLRPRHKRQALLAATVALAAAFGAAVGLKAGGGAAIPPPPHDASLAQTHAMQRTIGKLGKEIAALKARVAETDKATHNELAKLDAKNNAQLRNETAPEITGSIAAPATIPTPAPRPVVAAHRSPLVRNWTIRSVRAGAIFVENRGEVFLVQVGAPLPGLGRVEAVRREHGRWLVVTPKGLIVSMRDRRYFE